MTRTVSFGKVEENPISPRNASSTVTFSNDESSCWMNKKEIKLPNDFYKMPYFKTNESGQIVNDVDKVIAPPNSFLKSELNDEEKHENESSLASVSALTHSTSENNKNIENTSRTFTDALQKASLIEDIITRRNNKPAQR